MDTYKFVPEKGTVRITADLNVRKGKPATQGADVVGVIQAGALVPVLGYVLDGTAVGGNTKWYLDKNGDFFWSGSTSTTGSSGGLGKILKKPLDELVCTQKFGDRPEVYSLPAYGGAKGHNGMDFRTRSLTNHAEWKVPVYAVLGGKITEASEGPLNGKFVRIAHDNGYESVYLHLSSIAVKKDQRITAGSKIAISGNSGSASEGPHLHFGFRLQQYDPNNGYKGYIDPSPYFIDTIKYV